MTDYGEGCVIVIERLSDVAVQRVVQTIVISPTGAPPPGGSGEGVAGFSFVQSTPVLSVTINHNLGRRPSIELRDTGGRKYQADVEWPNVNQTVVTHASPKAFSAWLI